MISKILLFKNSQLIDRREINKEVINIIKLNILIITPNRFIIYL